MTGRMTWNIVALMPGGQVSAYKLIVDQHWAHCPGLKRVVTVQLSGKFSIQLLFKYYGRMRYKGNEMTDER